VSFDSGQILSILDHCCDAYKFPMLDNGYVYLAATRLSLYRSVADWAMVIEVFGFSPRSRLPDTHIHTFASQLHGRDTPDRYTGREFYDRYLANNPNNDSRFVFPIAAGPWQDADDGEMLAKDASEILVRGFAWQLPSLAQYARVGVNLEQPPRVRTFEVCRFLSEVARDQLLATQQERRVSVLPDMTQLLQLEEWHHPDLAGGDLASNSETFRQLAQVLATGDVDLYCPSQPANTHWRNWPEGGRL
jgi:hypothetical protein